MTIDEDVETRAKPTLEPGATFPDYELTGHDRKRHRLSEIQGGDPMILILSRGHFCPKDARQHKLLADFYPQIAVAYTKIVTISTDTVLQANEMRDAAGAQWLFLTDPQRKIQKDLAIQEYSRSTTATGSGDGPHPWSCGRTSARSAVASARTGT